MNQIETLALARAVDDKTAAAAREKAHPGTTIVDLTVRVAGTVKIAEDTEAAPTCRAMSLETLATALYYAGVTRENAILAILRATIGREEIGETNDHRRKDAITVITEQVRARFALQPKEPRRGQVSAALIVTEIESDEMRTRKD